MARREGYWRDYWRRRADPSYVGQRGAGPLSQWAYHLQKTYGLTAEAYEALLAAQGGTCRICQQPETLIRRGKIVPLMVDHDHASGRTRGLLCHRCTILIDWLGEEGNAQRAMAYLAGTL